MKSIAPRDNPCYCVGVRRAANALTKFYDRAMERTDLTIGQFSLLNDIKWLKSCNKSTLAQCAKLDRTTIIRNLRILYKRGYIAETPGTDKRNNLIRLTDSGEAAIAEGMVFWEQAQAKIKATFGRDNLENFMRISADIESLI